MLVVIEEPVYHRREMLTSPNDCFQLSAQISETKKDSIVTANPLKFECDTNNSMRFSMPNVTLTSTSQHSFAVLVSHNSSIA